MLGVLSFLISQSHLKQLPSVLWNQFYLRGSMFVGNNNISGLWGCKIGNNFGIVLINIKQTLVHTYIHGYVNS